MKRRMSPEIVPVAAGMDDDLKVYYQIVDVHCLAVHFSLKLRAAVTPLDVVIRASALGLSGGGV